MRLIALALLVCQGAVRAARDEAGQGKKKASMAGSETEFASCICNVILEGAEEATPVIVVTQPWDADLEAGTCLQRCPQACERFQEGATYKNCLYVHTPNGETGTNPAWHLSTLRPNIVDLSVTEALEEDVMAQMMKMTRHETYHGGNNFAACSCKKAVGDIEQGFGEPFLVGQSTYYGGLQVWGRTGCPNSCKTECSKFQAQSDGCILAAMTKRDISEIPESLDGNGYVTVAVSQNTNKRS